MLFETFHGSDLRTVFDEARRALGDDVLIIRSSVEREGARTRVEMIAASGDSLTELRRRLEPPPPSLPRTQGGRGRSGPFVVAFVGPTGAGKTTALAKLALNTAVFGGARIGLLTLDTYRVAAIEQLQQYAEIASLPLEVVYDVRDVPDALRRLDGCEVVLIDTPGRSPRATDANGQWQAMLRAATPDETHLVLPATTRPDLVTSLLQHFAGCRPSHLLLTKSDEIAQDEMLADVVARVEFPVRWLCDGQAVPSDIRPARARILSALGLTPNDLVVRAA